MSLFDPLPLGGWTSRNRFVLAPMTTWSSQPDGTISPDEIPYLRLRAQGGFGIVVSAACCVHPRGKAFNGQWGCWDDSLIPSLASAAQAIHDGGALAVLQLHHGGRISPSSLAGGAPLSASAIASPRPGAETPLAMTEEEIEEVIASFAAAARRAIEAGWDGVELHGANTYLIQQFVSPHSNRREDKWGQDRLLFTRRVIEAVLEAVDGRAFVGYRLSPEELEEPGIRWAETEELLDVLCESPLDYIHASLGHYKMKGLKGDWPEPTLSRMAAKIAGRKPFIGVGQVTTLAEAEEAESMGAQAVAVARAALTQPDWVKAVQEGRPVRTTFPKTGAAEVLTLPKGLEAQVYATPDRFAIED